MTRFASGHDEVSPRCSRLRPCRTVIHCHRRSRPLARSCRQNNGFWWIVETLLNISQSVSGALIICLQMGNCGREGSVLGCSYLSRSSNGTHASTTSALRVKESARAHLTCIRFSGGEPVEKYPKSIPIIKTLMSVFTGHLANYSL